MTSINISFIGMSGVGKTYWSKKLAQAGFNYYGIDELIEAQLFDKQKKEYKGIKGVAAWLGQPHEPNYYKRACDYIIAESRSMKWVLKKLEKDNKPNAVIDTTGSVYLTGPAICQKLKEMTTVVYLHTPNSVVRQMLKQYYLCPKPVIWGDQFKKIKNESNIKAIRRCYPRLLKFRTVIYKKYADLTLNYQDIRNPYYSTDYLIEVVREYLTNFNP